MQVLFIPQVNLKGDRIEYEFKGDSFTATLNGVTDVFDFTEFTEDGEVDVHNGGVETTLPVNPLRGAKREGGVLYLQLLKLIGLDAPEEEQFPEWQEVGVNNGGTTVEQRT